MTNRFRPDPAAHVGTYDTSECGGYDEAHAHITGVSAVFEIAAAQDLTWALRAMNPEDTSVPPNLVQTSPGLTVNRGDPDGDKRRITAAAERSHQQLQEMGYDIDPERGVVISRDHTRPWMSAAASLGPAVTVDESTDRSAG